jgi:hypothetical protein
VRGLAADTVWRHLTYSRALLNHFGVERNAQFYGLPSTLTVRAIVVRSQRKWHCDGQISRRNWHEALAQNDSLPCVVSPAIWQCETAAPRCQADTSLRRCVFVSGLISTANASLNSCWRRLVGCGHRTL